MAKLNGVLESALYVAEMAAARDFYETVMGLAPVTADHRFTAYEVGAGSVLLLFLKGATEETVMLPGEMGTIPPHGGGGHIHLAFAIDRETLVEWEARLASHHIAIEGRTHWPRGGESLYFRDPDDHLLELATPGIWPSY
ncbi:VOC family protein [Halomonas salifodinae]|uniref:VOC family protein n=1 Tax=Halomonas salifodinae TaxID=438745 RepID=UPI00339F5304